MAQLFLGESSRRTQQIPESEMEDRWAMAFGPRKKQTCSECNEPVHETRDGICDKCRSAMSNLTVETHTCVKCGRDEFDLEYVPPTPVFIEKMNFRCHLCGYTEELLCADETKNI